MGSNPTEVTTFHAERRVPDLQRLNPPSLKIPTKFYSQGIVIPLGAADLMFVTGQLAQDIDGNVIAPDDAAEQARVVYARIAAILDEAGMVLDNVVKSQIFVTRAGDIPAVSAVRDEVFKAARPASTLVVVNGFAKPGCLVEIEVTAVRLKA